jgi:hypothetical protein
MLCVRCRDDAGAAVGEIAQLLRRQSGLTRDDGGSIRVARHGHLEK